MNRICSRCDNGISEEWESQWPVHAKIIVGRSSQIWRGINHNYIQYPRDGWSESENQAMESFYNHPSVILRDAQQTIIQWHNQETTPLPWEGMGKTQSPWSIPEKGKHKVSPYRLCYQCHEDFLQLLGVFLGLHNETDRNIGWDNRRKEILTGLEYFK